MPGKRTYCAKCDAPRCLALVRADRSPKDIKDAVAFTFLIVASGHFSWYKAVPTVAAAVLVLLILMSW